MDDDFPESVEDIMGLGPDATDAEKEFFNVMEQLRGMEGMKFVSDVYTKLYDSYFEMKEARDQRQIAIDELTSRADKFDEIIASYQADSVEQNKTIEKLRADVDEARALADAMHARELAAVEALETMKRNVTRLEKELDARKKAGDDDLGAQSAAKEKEKFEKEKARLLTEIDTLKARVVNMQQYQEELDQKNTAAEEKIAKLEETLEEAENQAVRHNRLIEFLKNEKAKIKEEVDARGKTINELNEKNADLVETIEKFEKRVKQLNQELESAKQEQEAAVTKARQFRTSWEHCKKDLEQCQATLFHTTKELKHNIAEGQKFQMEIQKKAKEFAAASKKLTQMEARKSELESERDRLREQITVMEREISLRQKQSEEERREIENLNREKEILNKNMQKIQYEAMENLTMLNLQQNQRKQLDHEIDLNNKQLNKQRLMIRQLEKDKDRLLEEAIALNEKIDECMDEVRLRNADIADLKKDIRERSLNTRRLTVTLDATRAERNTLHKNLTEAQDEIQDLKQKLKMLAYQIEQLKEDIAGKETSLKSCESTLQKCYKKNDMLRVEIQSGQAKLSEARAEIAALKQEEARLHRIVQEGDAQRNKLLKELEGLMNERDVVGAQLVRRNDEITLLYEKIRILEITLHRGERQYEQRVEDIRLLRLEIIRLRKEKNLLSKGIENMTDLRLEVFNLERELGRERLRVRALEEALETPLNVHRWRKLQGTDPHSVHLTQKLRLTQKKVLVQSEMLVLKDRELKETRNLYGAVKDMLALQPSPEIQEKCMKVLTVNSRNEFYGFSLYENDTKVTIIAQTLNQTQRALAARTSKMKCMVAELSMRERQLCDLRLELKRTSEDLTSFKQKYYELKRALDADEARRLRIPTPKDKEYPPCVDTCPYNPCPTETGECEVECTSTVHTSKECVPTCPYRPSAKTLDKVRPKE